MSSSQTHIEPASLEDLPQLASLLADLFSHEADFRPDHEKQMRGLRLILEQPNRGRIFVLRAGDRIIGMVNLLITISTAEGGFVLLLEDLVIHHDHRGRGFGEQMLKYAVDYAQKKNFVRITLLTDRIDDPSRRFFRKHRFFESEMIPMRLLIPQAPGSESRGPMITPRL
jgi:GNAT superfamily N-acetyltransferase